MSTSTSEPRAVELHQLSATVIPPVGDGSPLADLPTMRVDGVVVHLVEAGHARALIADSTQRHPTRPLAVASVNLDHLHHFGSSRSSADEAFSDSGGPSVDWLNLIDGAPIAKQAERLTGTHYPKLSGSDLILSILDEAAVRGQRVGFLGGLPEVTESLATRLATDWPDLQLAGHWTPSRSELASNPDGRRIASEIAAQGVDILIVCLGKPRQEVWIEEFGALTGAGVLLAFGAVVDFLAGRVSRAPRWISHAGMEWAWRLALEPRRLARRYLIQGPPAYAALRRSRAA